MAVGWVAVERVVVERVGVEMGAAALVGARVGAREAAVLVGVRVAAREAAALGAASAVGLAAEEAWRDWAGDGNETGIAFLRRSQTQRTCGALLIKQ